MSINNQTDTQHHPQPADDPADLLAAIHKQLHPEFWKNCNPDLLNDIGEYEWLGAEDLEVIASIVNEAKARKIFTPDNQTEETK